MKICIRDDDLCYWSNANDFKNIYDDLGIKVSISVVPYSFANHDNLMIFGNDFPRDKSEYVGNNVSLVNIVKKGISEGKYDILIHGYSHEYKKEIGELISETVWKDEKRLEEEIKKAKENLENTFSQNISIYSSPANQIGKKGIKVISSLGLDYCGIACRPFERKFSLKFLKHLVRRYLSRILFGYPLVGVTHYRTHRELYCVPLFQLDKLIKYYNICKRKNWDFIIFTHYWELAKNDGMYQTLKQFTKYIKEVENKEFSLLSEIV